MKYYTIIAVTLFALNSLYAQIYTWTDSDGVVHFSDIPHQGAKEVSIPTTQSTANNPPNPELANHQLSPSEPDKDDYKIVVISEPKNDTTIRNNAGYIPVVVEMDPPLKEGHLLQIIFDGSTLGKPQSNMLFALKDVKRGTHTLAVQVLDEQGNILNTSQNTTIYMHRPTVGMVPSTQKSP